MTAPYSVLYLFTSVHPHPEAEKILADSTVRWKAVGVPTRAKALESLFADPPTVILADYRLESVPEYAFLRTVSGKFPGSPVVFLAERADEDTMIDALRQGASDFVLESRISRLAPAIRRGFLEAEDRIIRQKLDQDLHEHTRLALLQADAGRALIKSDSLPSMLRQCAEIVVRRLDAAFARVWILNSRDNTLELKASAGMYTHLDGAHGRIPVGHLKIGLIAAERKPHLTNSVIGDPRVGNQEWAKTERIVAFGGYPLIVEDELVGVLAMFSRQPLTDAAFQALATVADSIALGIERLRIEERLRVSEERFALAVRGSSEGIWDWDLKTNTLFFSERFKNLLGFADEEFPDSLETFNAHVHPDDFADVTQAFYHHLEGGPPYDVEYRLRTKSGEFRWFHARGEAVRDHAGKPSRIAGSITDITERREAERRLRESTLFVERIMEMIPDLVYIFDIPERRFVHVNPRVFTLLGYSVDQVLELRSELLAALADPDDARMLNEQFEAAYSKLSDGHVVETEYRVKHRNGSRRWLAGRNTVFSRFPDGRPKQILGVAQDITARKQTDEALKLYAAKLEIAKQGAERNAAKLTQTVRELNDAKLRAEAADRAKSEFLANVSHEIRTPMNGILGMTELVLDTDLTPEQRENLNLVKAGADSLLAIINDILDFSKIEAGKLDLNPVDFRLSDLLDSTLRFPALRAHEKGVELIGPVTSEVPDRLIGDPLRLRQIIVNLVGNAVKFTESGEIVLSVEVDSREDEFVVLRFSIRDTGIGIPPEKQALVFQAFTQADGSTTRRFGGTGLGLSICKQLVELMTGRIWLESDAGKGSTFHFTARFGLSSAPETSGSKADPDLLAGRRVLIVDDNSTNRGILSRVLKKWGAVPDEAANGETALRTLRSVKPDLILLDVQMPDLDGFAVARHIRAEYSSESPPIILLTSGDRIDNPEKNRELGIAVCLQKPVSQAELGRKISSVLGLSASTTEERSIPERRPVAFDRKLRILLTEDNIVNQKLALGILNKMGHSVVVAGNGRQALERLERETFDLVLMDIQMPVMSGFEATRRIREKERASGTHIPIVAMTAHAMKGDRERCLEAGMDEYVSKPIQISELTAVMENLMSDSPENNPTAAATFSSDPDSREVFDLEKALLIVDGDREFLQELIVTFLEDSPRTLETLRAELAAGNAQGVERAAHSLKGAVANFAAQATFDAAKELETLGRRRDLTGAEAMFRELETQLDRLETVLRQV